MATRRSNKRKRRNRGRFGFLYMVVSMILILVVVVAGCAVFFRVDKMVVAGQTQYTSVEVIAASGIQKGDNLFSLNINQAVRNIRATLPYVDEVSIRRTLPDGLLFSVSECRPAVLVQGGDAWWVVDGKGKILEGVASSPHPGTASVAGLTALLPLAGTELAVEPTESARLQTLLDLVAALEGRGVMDKVADIDLTGNARLTFTYDGRFTVVMPIIADFDRKVFALKEIVTQLQPNDSGKIDITHDENVPFSPN